MALVNSFKSFNNNFKPVLKECSRKSFLCNKVTTPVVSDICSVPLNYDQILPNNDNKLPSTPILFLHGLLGNRRSLKNLSPFFFDKGKQIFPDQRNHGKSPHTDRMPLEAMAADIVTLLNTLEIDKAGVIGHSMGGRVAMALALIAPERVASLAVLDIAPIYIDSSLEHEAKARIEIFRLLSLLETMPIHTMESKKEAEQWLIETSKNEFGEPLKYKLLQFVLQNIHVSNKNLYWLPNIPVLKNRFNDDILHWPFNGLQFCNGPTVFIRGRRSPWVQEHHISDIRQCFPEASISCVDADHWVHRDAPDDVAREIRKAWYTDSNVGHSCKD